MNTRHQALRGRRYALYLIASALALLVQLPGLAPLWVMEHYWHKTQLLRQRPRGVALVGAVHKQSHLAGLRDVTYGLDQPAPLRSISGLAWRQTPGDNVAGTRGNQMKFGGPAAPALADGLGTVFFGAPVPSGCTLMRVESRLTTSMRTTIRRSRCSRSNAMSSTPALAQRLMRV